MNMAMNLNKFSNKKEYRYHNFNASKENYFYTLKILYYVGFH